MKQDRLVLTAGFMPAAVLAVLMVLERAAGIGLLPRTPWVSALLEVAVYLAPMLVLRVLPNGEGNRARFRFQGYKRQTGWMVLWMSLAAAVLSLLVGSLQALAMGRAYGSGVFLLGLQSDASLLSAVLPAVMVAVVEELFFRGVMFSALESCGTWPALILTSVAYAALQGELSTMAGPLIEGMVYGYLTYVLGSVWPAMAAHGLRNILSVMLERGGQIYALLDLWQYILLIFCFSFCMFLALAMRALEAQMEKGRIRRLRYQPPGVTLTTIFMSPGMWLMCLLVVVRALY